MVCDLNAFRSGFVVGAEGQTASNPLTCLHSSCPSYNPVNPAPLKTGFTTCQALAWIQTTMGSRLNLSEPEFAGFVDLQDLKLHSSCQYLNLDSGNQGQPTHSLFRTYGTLSPYCFSFLPIAGT
jgi:hypothetical protein